MMNKEEFTKIAKGIIKSSKGLQSPKIIHPNREWFTGLLITLLIFAASGVWSAQMYLQYRDTSVTENVEASDEGVVYREAMVNSALEDLAERQNNYDDLVSYFVTNSSVEEIIVKEEEVEVSTSTESTEEESGNDEAANEEETEDVSEEVEEGEIPLEDKDVPDVVSN